MVLPSGHTGLLVCVLWWTPSHRIREAASSHTRFFCLRDSRLGSWESFAVPWLHINTHPSASFSLLSSPFSLLSNTFPPGLSSFCNENPRRLQKTPACVRVHVCYVCPSCWFALLGGYRFTQRKGEGVGRTCFPLPGVDDAPPLVYLALRATLTHTHTFAHTHASLLATSENANTLALPTNKYYPLSPPLFVLTVPVLF